MKEKNDAQRICITEQCLHECRRSILAGLAGIAV